jgi:hypothetical protein
MSYTQNEEPVFGTNNNALLISTGLIFGYIAGLTPGVGQAVLPFLVYLAANKSNLSSRPFNNFAISAHVGYAAGFATLVSIFCHNRHRSLRLNREDRRLEEGVFKLTERLESSRVLEERFNRLLLATTPNLQRASSSHIV